MSYLIANYCGGGGGNTVGDGLLAFPKVFLASNVSNDSVVQVIFSKKDCNSQKQMLE